MTWEKWNFSVVVVVIILVIISSIVLEICLNKINESLSIESSIKAQVSSDALYGRILIGQDYIYKLEMAKIQKADVLALGSSRVMEFRKECFASSFYNAGGAVPTAEEGLIFVNELLKEYQPKVIIYGVDIWWLNPNFKIEVRKDKFLAKNNFLYNRLFLYGALMNNNSGYQISKIFLESPDLNSRTDPVEHRKAIGLMAAQQGNGFRPDGTYQYGSYISGKIKRDLEFKEAIDSIQAGKWRFPMSNSINTKSVDTLRQTIKLLKERGVKVVLFAPPFPHKVYEELEKRQGDFLRKYRTALEGLAKEQNVPFFDFSDLSSTGADDQEVIDGLHASEKAYGRILRIMATDSALKSHVDTRRIEGYLKDHDNPIVLIQPKTL